MRVQASIQKWGNSLALRLTGPMRSIPQFEENMRVNIEIEEEGIRVSPVRLKIKKKMFKEADLLKGLTPKTSHGDEIAHLTKKDIPGI